jgi:hypothetical protein
VRAGPSRRMKNRFTVRHGGSRPDGSSGRARSGPVGPDTSGPDTEVAAGGRRRRGNQRHGAAAQGPRRLVSFKIVGPLLIQADIIGGVCYLHTLVRNARTRSYNEEEHGKPLRAILGVDRRCYRRPTACSPTCLFVLHLLSSSLLSLSFSLCARAYTGSIYIYISFSALHRSFLLRYTCHLS